MLSLAAYPSKCWPIAVLALGGLAAAVSPAVLAEAGGDLNGKQTGSFIGDSQLNAKARFVHFERNFEDSATDTKQAGLGLELNYSSGYWADIVGINLSGYHVQKLDASGFARNDILSLKNDGDYDESGDLDDEDVVGSVPGVTRSEIDVEAYYLDLEWQHDKLMAGVAYSSFDDIWVEDNFAGDHGTNPFPTRGCALEARRIPFR